jgi:predicted dehydrogenase
MGLSHLALFNAHPDIDLVALCDQNKILLDTLSQYSSFKTYTDYAVMLDKEPLDAVIVATPSKFHAPIVRAALERGLHVFCEKPFCLDPEEGQALAELADQRGVRNQVGYHYRFVGAFMEVKRLLEANTIGRVHNVRVEAYGPVVLRPKASTWRSSKSEGGGCLYDYASHGIDLLNYLFGAPESVRGTVLGKIFSSDVDDEVYSTLVYPDGMTGQVLANWSDESQRKMSMKVSIWGEGGKIEADRQEVRTFMRDEDAAKDAGLNKGWNVRYTTELTEEVWYYLRGEEYSAQVDHFAACIADPSLENRSPFASAVQSDLVAARMIADAEGAPQVPAPVRQPTSQPRRRFGLFGSRS